MLRLTIEALKRIHERHVPGRKVPYYWQCSMYSLYFPIFVEYRAMLKKKP